MHDPNNTFPGTAQEDERIATARQLDEARAAAQGAYTAWTRLFDLMAHEDAVRAELDAVEELISEIAALNTTYSPLAEGMAMTSEWTMASLEKLVTTARAMVARWDAKTPS